jgi:hypothetical protein
MSALSTKTDSPSVSIVTGKVSSSKTGRTVAFTIPKTRATNAAVVKLLISTPGTMCVTRSSEEDDDEDEGVEFSLISVMVLSTIGKVKSSGAHKVTPNGLAASLLYLYYNIIRLSGKF